MSTAIIMSHRPEGFFIAADCRSRREDNSGICTVFRDDEQKIFQIGDDLSCFTFALTGTPRFTSDDDDNDTIFDFISEIPRASKEVETASDAPDYCNRPAMIVNGSLAQLVENALQAGKRIKYPSNPDKMPGSTIAILFLCGYYSRRPYHIATRFFHDNQNLQQPSGIYSLDVGQSAISGSEIIARFLYNTSDAGFSRFRLSPSAPFVQIAHNYIAACASEEGLAADPVICPGIGGRIHCVQVTLERGSEWLEPPS